MMRAKDRLEPFGKAAAAGPANGDWIGMIPGTILVILFAPLFYVLIEKISGKRNPQPAVEGAGTNPSGNQPK